MRPSLRPVIMAEKVRYCKGRGGPPDRVGRQIQGRFVVE
jgi:hypothetical protein